MSHAPQDQPPPLPAAETENPFKSPEAPPRQASWQFSLRGLLGTTAGFALLFGLLTLLGIDPTNTLVAFVSSVVGVGMAIGLVTLFWELTGGPRPRR